MKEHIFK